MARHQVVVDQSAGLLGGVPSDIFFHSDWSTATGTTDAALRDTDKALPWDQDKSGGDTRVAATSSISGTAPSGMTNCLVVGARQAASEGVRMDGGLPAFPVGGHQYRRFYINVVLPDATIIGDNAWHPYDIRGVGLGDSVFFQTYVGDTGGGAGTWYPTVQTKGTTNNTGGLDKWVLGTSVGAGSHPLGQSRLGSTALNKNTWYGLEYHFFRRTTSFIQLVDAWVYDDAGTTLYDSSDWYQNNESDIPLSSGPHDWDIVDADIWKHQQIGINGNESSAQEDEFAWGGVAFSNSQQVGPWTGTY